MPKYIPEYDTRIIDENGWIEECDTRLYEDFDSGDRLFWVNINDNYAISGSIEAIPTNNDFRWFRRHIKRKGLTPYIKIRTFHLKESIVSGVCRISIYNPKYITGYNENLVLSADIIDVILSELNKTFVNSLTGKEMTRWEWGIDCLNTYYGSKKCKYMVPWGLKIPDYYKLLKEN